MKRNETKNTGCIMSLELWIFSKEMYRETRVPTSTHSKFPIDCGCYF